METLNSEVVVVGGGASGLWAAKALIDDGRKVVLVEEASTLAPGASTRNEGWLHAGTYHAVGIADKGDAETVVSRTKYGHEAILQFAPDAINEARSLSFTYNQELASVALERWRDFEVPYREVGTQTLNEEGVATDNIAAAFEVKDKSINTYELYRKLARYIVDHGGMILTDASFTARDGNEGEIHIGDENIRLQSDFFIITAGAGLRRIAEDVTKRTMQTRFYKAHLLVGPQLTVRNCFSLDIGEAGIMNHKKVSVIGINRDGIQLSEPDYDIEAEKEQLLHSALGRMLVGYESNNALQARVRAVACCKPDVYADSEDVQSLNAQLFPLSENYIGALPGKMTETPFLAKSIADLVKSYENNTVHPMVNVTEPTRLVSQEPRITPRPADIWLETTGAAS